jgi:hypothetical protein
MKHKKGLVLNADYTCIGLAGWENIATAIFKDQVDVVDFYSNDKIICADGSHFPVAAVVACKQFKKHLNKVPFSRKNIFIRDRLTCQYCGQRMHFSKLTFDHVHPRVEFRKRQKKKKGETPTTWENIVTCCHPCNHKKGPMTLEKSGMTLIKQPKELHPHGYVKGIAPWTLLQKEWLPYLPVVYRDICEIDN